MVKAFKNTIKKNETHTQSKKLLTRLTRVSLEDDVECMHTVAN
jgi:hypothetical protein